MAIDTDVRVPAGPVELIATMAVPRAARGVVLFAHGSGSSRHSPRNRAVADQLNADGYATVLVDLLTATEDEEDRLTRRHRFDIALLGERLGAAVDWAAADHEIGRLPLGLFGASTGAAAALLAAADRAPNLGAGDHAPNLGAGDHAPNLGAGDHAPNLTLGDRAPNLAAVVSRGGRPDLAGAALTRVRTPTLLIVGGADRHVLALNRDAARTMGETAQVVVVAGATHLFEEPGALDEVTRLARGWFETHMDPSRPVRNGPPEELFPEAYGWGGQPR